MARPHVTVNFAMSVDGKIALPARKPTRISDEEDLRRVHQLRATCDAVLVGVGTVLADDPKLTVKPEHATGRNPLRVVLDSEGRTPFPPRNSKSVRRLLVEGGEEVIWSFLHGRLADEVKVFVGSMAIGGRTSPTPAGGAGAQHLEEIVPLKLESAKPLGSGVLLEYAVVR